MPPSSENVTYDATKLSGLRSRMTPNWIAGVVPPSRKGVFKKKAQAAGMSTGAYARKEAGASGTLGREARLAETFAKIRPKKKHSLRDRLLEMHKAGAFKKARAA